jgi:hypothetical protein
MRKAKTKTRPRKLKLFVGWDGAWVMSKPMVVRVDNGFKFITSDVALSIVDIGEQGHAIFGDLKLKKYEVVQLSITASKVTQ